MRLHPRLCSYRQSCLLLLAFSRWVEATLPPMASLLLPAYRRSGSSSKGVRRLNGCRWKSAIPGDFFWLSSNADEKMIGKIGDRQRNVGRDEHN